MAASLVDHPTLGAAVGGSPPTGRSGPVNRQEQFRAIFAGDLTRAQAAELLDRWCARAQRSRLAPFIKAARTMRHRRDLILNAIEHGLSNGRVEGLNTKVRLIVRRAYGFHSADAALALVMLGAGPVNLKLPHEHPPALAAA